MSRPVTGTTDGKPALFGSRVGAPSLHTVAAIVVLGAIFLVGLAPRLDTDLWWHLAAGHSIVSRVALPRTDPWSFTELGHSWIDHEWLAELAMWGSYRLAGLWGPIVLFAGVIWLTFLLVYRRMLRYGVQPLLGLAVLLLGFFAASPIIGARIQMLSLLFVAVYLTLLDRYRRRPSVKILVLIPLLMVPWANMHAGFILGLIVLAATWAGATLNDRGTGAGRTAAIARRRLGLATVATMMAPLVSPHGVYQLRFPFEVLGHRVFTDHINEWMSPDFHLVQFMIFELLILLLFAGMAVARQRPDWIDLLLVLALTILALNEGRDAAAWVVVVGPIVARTLAAAGAPLRAAFAPHGFRSRPVPAQRAGAINLVTIVLVAALYIFETTGFVNGVALARAETTSFPSRAATFLATHRAPTNLFASYAWGGYVIWRLAPQYRDAIDGRAWTVFSARDLEDYLAAYSAAPGWQQILKRRQVGSVLLDPTAPLTQALRESREWRLLYHDVQADVFVRAPRSHGP